ncbi:MAG TPA: penicillin-binding protein 2 [Stellaceae bacterium]|jgi:penicillin-binding protein 2|nr:penicillin-binding protein 2 [Stellaceae bacterium]
MDRENNTKNQLLTRRALLLGGAQGALFATLAGRMYYLQVVQADRYAMLADENRINIRLVAPPRGRILDRFGAVLADNRPTYRVVLVAEQAGDIPSTVNAVGTLIPVSDTDRRRVLRDLHNKHSFVPVMIRENLSWEEMARIEVNTLELPGVSIEQGRLRHYPFGDNTAHVLGYVAAVSEEELTGEDPLLELPDFRIGKSGIEKSHDLDLRGSAGTSQVEVNAYGRVVRELAREEGIAGQDIALTIDMALQDFAGRRCAVEKSAACVLMDAWTGDVLSMVSSPGFDPHGFVSGWSQAEWDTLQNDPAKPLNNKAISGTYAPGSTFKPVVAMAALETGVITPETRFNCPGFFQFGNVTFHCWKKGGHGSMDLHDGIKHSCDVYFFELTRRLGIDHIADMARRFGLGSAVGIDIPGEATGLIPSSNYMFHGSNGLYKWQPGDTISAGIGQSVIAVTPLQLATYAARLVTGRAVVPHLTRDGGVMAADSDAPPSREFPAIKLARKDLALVVSGMNAVVNEQGGTAYAARIAEPGMQMGGKSGTSQVRHITQAEREHGLRKIKDVPWKERDNALFISFAPVSAPRYVCAVIVEHGGESAGGGSAVAAPICRDVLRETQKRDPARRVPERPFGSETTVAQGS